MSNNELDKVIDSETDAILEAAGKLAGGRTTVCRAIAAEPRAMEALSSAVLRIIQLRAEADGLPSFQWDKADRLRESASTKHRDIVGYLVNVTKLHVTVPSAATREKLRRAVGG